MNKVSVYFLHKKLDYVINALRHICMKLIFCRYFWLLLTRTNLVVIKRVVPLIHTDYVPSFFSIQPVEDKFTERDNFLTGLVLLYTRYVRARYFFPRISPHKGPVFMIIIWFTTHDDRFFFFFANIR